MRRSQQRPMVPLPPSSRPFPPPCPRLTLFLYESLLSKTVSISVVLSVSLATSHLKRVLCPGSCVIRKLFTRNLMTPSSDLYPLLSTF